MKNKSVLLSEGQIEDLVAKHPDKLRDAYDRGLFNNLKPAQVLWLSRQNEPVDDIIDLLHHFERAKGRLQKKDLAQYTSGELRQTLEELEPSKTQQLKGLKANSEDEIKDETTILGTWDDWTVLMPHSAKSSIYWGKGTTWCTSASSTSNLFLNYVARKHEDIILFYIINANGDVSQDKNAKLAVSFRNGVPVLDGTDGGLSVNADNKGLTKDTLQKILGNNCGPIMDAMTLFSAQIKGRHPSKLQMEKLSQSQNFNLLRGYLRNMDNDDVKRDFLKQLLEYDLSLQTKFKLINLHDPVILSTILLHYNNRMNFKDNDKFTLLYKPHLNDETIAQTAIKLLFEIANDTGNYKQIETVIAQMMTNSPIYRMIEPYLYQISDEKMKMKLLKAFFYYETDFTKVYTFVKNCIKSHPNDGDVQKDCISIIETFIQTNNRLSDEEISKLENLFVTTKSEQSVNKINRTIGKLLSVTSNESILRKYANEEAAYEFLVRNKNTPLDILNKIFLFAVDPKKSSKTHHNMLTSLFYNSSFPLEIIEEYVMNIPNLFTYENESILNTVLDRLMLSGPLQNNHLQLLSKLLFSNNYISYKFIEKYVGSDVSRWNPFIIRKILQHPSSDIRRMFLHISDWYTLPQDVLLSLLQDQDEGIRNEAKEYLEKKKEKYPEILKMLGSVRNESKRFIVFTRTR